MILLNYILSTLQYDETHFDKPEVFTQIVQEINA